MSPGSAYVLMPLDRGGRRARRGVGMGARRHGGGQPVPGRGGPGGGRGDPGRGAGGPGGGAQRAGRGGGARGQDPDRRQRGGSGAHPQTTYLDLVGEEHLPEEVVRKIRRYRTRSGSMKVNLALGELPAPTA